MLFANPFQNRLCSNQHKTGFLILVSLYIRVIVSARRTLDCKDVDCTENRVRQSYLFVFRLACLFLVSVKDVEAKFLEQAFLRMEYLPLVLFA